MYPTGPIVYRRFARDWRELEALVHRYELFNRRRLFAWVAGPACRASRAATSTNHRISPGWKTLVPCAKDEEAVVGYLRSPLPVYLARLEPDPAVLIAA